MNFIDKLNFIESYLFLKKYKNLARELRMLQYRYLLKPKDKINLLKLKIFMDIVNMIVFEKKHKKTWSYEVDGWDLEAARPTGN